MIGGDSHGASKARILVVDDDEANRRFLERLLDIGGYDNVLSASSGTEALEKYVSHSPDLILLDLHMPGTDGREVLKTLRMAEVISDVYLPILVFTADATSKTRNEVLELGASDFLTKPGDTTEILLRVKNFLHMRSLSQALSDRNIDLESRVRARTAELEQAQVEIVERLALTGEHHDAETGHHTVRVGHLSGEIAQELGLPVHVVRLIRLAARLHDLGKVGIPDAILLKPGPLTKEEYDVVKEHCKIGATILSQGRTPLLHMAERIAASHHEHFNGRGYPQGLAGEAIPIEARIVAVADVFDALTHGRPYKKAWTVSEAIDEIRSQSGRQFDSQVVEAFLAVVNSESHAL